MFDKLKKLFVNEDKNQESCCDFDIEEIEPEENAVKKKVVKEKYSRIIKGEFEMDCCSADNDQQIPSFGVGDPLKFADLQSKERVLDIGSGPGKNCLQAAEEVGEKGQVVGLDISEDMITAADKEARKQEIENIKFVVGDAEKIPFDDQYFDVVISDCVLNLVPDKKKAFKEINRVLKQGGRIAISDVVSSKTFPTDLKQDEKLWCGCVSGALPEEEYLQIIKESGFKNLEVVEKKETEQQFEDIKIFHITVTAVK